MCTGKHKEFYWLCKPRREPSQTKQSRVPARTFMLFDCVRRKRILSNRPTWLEYVYRTAHPALRWLPTKLAEWIGENLQDKLGFPDKADTRAAAGTGLGEILVMGLGLGWSFGRGKPRLGGLSIVQTHERQAATTTEARRKRAAEPKRVRKTAPA